LREWLWHCRDLGPNSVGFDSLLRESTVVTVRDCYCFWYGARLWHCVLFELAYVLR
jgi:hypothetical protein